MRMLLKFYLVVNKKIIRFPLYAKIGPFELKNPIGSRFYLYEILKSS